MTTSKTMAVALLASCLGLVVRAETPDFLAEMLRSDGAGYIDTGYKFKVSDYPKTKRIAMSFYCADWGRGTAPGPVITTTSPNLFGEGSFYLGYNGGNKGNVVFAGDNHYVRTTADVVGDNVISVDFIEGTYTWGSTSAEFTPQAADSSYACSVFCYRYKNERRNPSVIKLKTLQIYDQLTEGAGETPVHDFVPCFKDGKAALYDKVAEKILYPTSDGFALFGYDIAPALGHPLPINSVDSAPRNLTLVADSELVFDGKATLQPSGTVTLPAVGSAVVSLPRLSGCGRYVLIDGLPADYDLAAFRIGTLPEWCTGTLSKEGTKLVLTLSSDASSLPDALAETLTSDAHGYIDVGYKFKGADYPKTARIEFDFYTSNYGKGTVPGPTNETTIPALLGATGGVSFRYNGKNGQVLYKKTNDATYQYVRSGQNGEVSIVADRTTQTCRWNSITLENVGFYTADSSYPYYLFSRNLEGSADVRGVFDFKRLKFYEEDSAGGRTLACDLWPCVSEGRPAAYDAVAKSVRYPIDSTNGFAVAGVRWRLYSAGELSFVSGEVSLNGPDGAAGWIAVRDADGVVVARGTGTLAEFTMPEAATTVRWTEDASKGGSVSVDQDLFFNRLTLSAETDVSFVAGKSICLSDGLTLPVEGTVSVSVEELDAAGNYVLIDGVDAGTALSRFQMGELPDGFTGRLELHGTRLVMRVTGSDAVTAALPDALASVLRSDGKGYIDTGYKFKATTFPRTKRYELDFYTTTCGGKGETVPVFGESTFYARFNGGNKGQVMYADGNSSSFITGDNVKGDNCVKVDFVEQTGTWGATGLDNLVLPSADIGYSWYLFRYNKKGTATGEASILDFKDLKIYEQATAGAAESLAHDFVPCVKDGKVGLYDQVTADYTYPIGDTNGFTVVGMNWPTEMYSSIRQTFSRLTTTSWRPVKVSEFTSEGEYAFVADGSLVLASTADSLTVERYGANGSLVSSETAFDLPAGTFREVKLNDAVKAVVKVVGTVPAEPIVQDLGIVEVAGTTETLVRQTAKRRYEFLVTGDVTFTAKTGLCEAFADSYDAAGEQIGTTKVADSVAEGGSFIVEKGDAAKVIVRVTLTPPGLILFVR